MKHFLSELRLYICNNIISKMPSRTIRRWFYISIMKFTLAKGSGIHMNCTFNAAKGLSIGNNSVLNSRCRIDTRGSIKIGNNVAVSNEVIILTADHDVNTIDFAGRTKAVLIDDYVWIGTRAMILPGITLGYGCVVAAGSVVTKNVNPFELVAGVPAKKIGVRNHEFNYQYNTFYNRLFH